MSQQIREIQEIGNNVIANTLANDWTFQIFIALIGGGFLPSSSPNLQITNNFTLY